MPYEAIYETSQLHPGSVTGIMEVETQVCGLVNYYSSNEGEYMPSYKIDLYRGNNRTLRVYVKNKDLDIVNLAGVVGLLTCKKTKDSTTTTFTKSTAVSGQGEIGAADEGEMFFYIVPANTTSLTGQYVFDIKITRPDGKIYTVAEGIFNLMKTVG